jgi:hypothetical protein
MPLMLINAPDEVAVEAVRHLASIQVLAVVSSQAPAASPEAKPEKPRNWAGLLPKETGERMLKEVANLREEWEQNS